LRLMLKIGILSSDKSYAEKDERFAITRLKLSHYAAYAYN